MSLDSIIAAARHEFADLDRWAFRQEFEALGLSDAFVDKAKAISKASPKEQSDYKRSVDKIHELLPSLIDKYARAIPKMENFYNKKENVVLSLSGRRAGELMQLTYDELLRFKPKISAIKDQLKTLNIEAPKEENGAGAQVSPPKITPSSAKTINAPVEAPKEENDGRVKALRQQ